MKNHRLSHDSDKYLASARSISLILFACCVLTSGAAYSLWSDIQLYHHAKFEIAEIHYLKARVSVCNNSVETIMETPTLDPDASRCWKDRWVGVMRSADNSGLYSVRLKDPDLVEVTRTPPRWPPGHEFGKRARPWVATFSRPNLPITFTELSERISLNLEEKLNSSEWRKQVKKNHDRVAEGARTRLKYASDRLGVNVSSSADAGTIFVAIEDRLISRSVVLPLVNVSINRVWSSITLFAVSLLLLVLIDNRISLVSIYETNERQTPWIVLDGREGASRMIAKLWIWFIGVFSSLILYLSVIQISLLDLMWSDIGYFHYVTIPAATLFLWFGLTIGRRIVKRLSLFRSLTYQEKNEDMKRKHQKRNSSHIADIAGVFRNRRRRHRKTTKTT